MVQPGCNRTEVENIQPERAGRLQCSACNSSKRARRLCCSAKAELSAAMPRTNFAIWSLHRKKLALSFSICRRWMLWKVAGWECSYICKDGAETTGFDLSCSAL